MTRAEKSTAVPQNWIRNSNDRAAVAEGCYFDFEAGDRVCRFFETFLCHSKGKFSRAKFLLEEWQRDFLMRLFGWKRPDGTRRFRECFLEVPKKNGKSTLLSGIVLYMIFEEAAAEVYLGAVDRSQASIVFDECCRMVKASPMLDRHLRCIKSKKTIVFDAADSKIVAMSADAPSKDGVSSSCTVLDEVHRFKNDSLYDVMKYAGAARSQPLLVCITTAGYDRHSLCYRLHQTALGVCDGTVDNIEFLGIVYGADPEKDDFHDPKTWLKANPSMPAVLSLIDFRKAYEEAKRIPRLWNKFLRLRLNVWTEAAVRWLPVETWHSLARSISPDKLRGCECYAALDLSSTKDLTALVLVFPHKRKNWAHVLSFFFLPGETADQRSETDKVPYTTWIEQGHAIETEGSATDHEAIRLKLLELRDTYKIKQVGLDTWNGMHLFNLLDADGFNVVGVRQGFVTLSEPSKDLERRVLDGTITHDGNPILSWCIANAAVETDAAENIKPSKKKSTERIDGVIALVMGLHLMNHSKPAAKPKISYI